MGRCKVTLASKVTSIRSIINQPPSSELPGLESSRPGHITSWLAQARIISFPAHFTFALRSLSEQFEILHRVLPIGISLRPAAMAGSRDVVKDKQSKSNFE
jgi:hypothetical protein